MNGSELKELRTRLSLTQAALAKEAGVLANTLARWERGKSTMPESAEKIVRYLVDQGTKASTVTWTQAIIRDPHHRAIIDVLNDRVDRDAFEACAADLLKKDWPTLVPVQEVQTTAMTEPLRAQTEKYFHLLQQQVKK